MTWHARDGGVWRTITAPSVRVSGTWQPVQEAWVKVSGVWQQFYSAFSAAASPATVSGIGNVLGPGNATATTSATTATPTGGTGPYTYAVQYVSGDTATVNSPTSATTTFTRSVFMNPGDPQVNRSGLYRFEVTDSLSAVVYTNNVTVNTEHNEIT
jgi:hypothetical protein